MHVALPINASTGAKRVAQKIKADSWVLLRTIPILAVHDTRLVGMPFARVQKWPNRTPETVR